jgi:hypothetical protein
MFPATRIAVSLLFLVNGFTVGSWAPMIPEFKARLGLSETTLGLMIVAFGVGSLVAMPLASFWHWLPCFALRSPACSMPPASSWRCLPFSSPAR